jgi:hypothetical protein
VNVPDFEERVSSIQRFMPENDKKRLYELLELADRDRLNGAAGMMSFARVDGDYSRFLIHFYFLNETDGSKRFYGAARDVTEMARLSNHMALLSRHSSRSVVFLVREHGRFRYEVAAHGLEATMKLSKAQVEAELNDGSFYNRLSDTSVADMLKQENALGSARKGFSQALALRDGDGYLPVFKEKWIPMEARYHEICGVPEACVVLSE